MVCVLTSEHLQCSKEACRNSLAATLYFLFSISASPAAHLSRVAISRLAGSWALAGCACVERGRV